MVRTKKEKSAYDQEYQKSHMKHIGVWFNLEKDRDIIEHLESQPGPVTAYVKTLIRQDIENKKK